MVLNNTRQTLDIAEITTFYENVSEVWPENDKWHQYSKLMIENFIQKNQRYLDNIILNAGSGGNRYGLANKAMVHVDVAENKIMAFDEYVVSSVENMPFDNCFFNSCICVGSVINYCDAVKALSEIFRVLKSNAYFILEYESSYGYEYIHSDEYMKAAQVVKANYHDQILKQWVYSPFYIKEILTRIGFRIIKIKRFHIASSLIYSYIKNTNKATNYAKLDSFLFLRHLPPFRFHASNEIYLCKRL